MPLLLGKHVRSVWFNAQNKAPPRITARSPEVRAMECAAIIVGRYVAPCCPGDVGHDALARETRSFEGEAKWTRS